MAIIEKLESGQKFVSFVMYYNDYCVLDVFHVLAYYAHLCIFTFFSFPYMRKFCGKIAEILQHAEVYVTCAFDSRQGTATLYTHLQLLL